jgi:hypothetical protein
MNFKLVPHAIVLMIAALIVTTCQQREESPASATETATATASATPAAQDEIARNIATFDDLDFNVFSNQKWDELSRSHHKDILVHWPDGHTTTGIEKHIQDLKAMFVYAPDTRIKEHPIKIGQGDFTAVTGIMEGTFTQPMPAPDGKSIAPTGKAFKLSMCTVGRWKDGVMVEEYLYWDNQTYMTQLGLGK